METKPIFFSSLMAGVIISIILVIFKLVLFLLDVDEQSYLQFIYYIIFALGLAWAMYSVRNNRLDRFATYGKAFAIGLYASIAVAIVMAIYTYVYVKYIDPAFLKDMLSQAEDKIIETHPDMPEDELNKMVEMAEMFMQPGLMALISIFGSVIWGLLLSLIIAIFVRRESTTIEV